MKIPSRFALIVGSLLAAQFAHAQTSPLPKNVQDALSAALEDEYHAEAAYAGVIEKFGNITPFVNIIQAERQHQNAVLQVMKAHAMAAPPNPYANGSKPKPAIPATVALSCKMGVTAEIENKKLYDEKLLPAAKGFEDVTRVFIALRDASQNNHLPAFSACAR